MNYSNSFNFLNGFKALIFGLFLFYISLGFSQSFSFQVIKQEEGFLVLEKGHPVLFYRTVPKSLKGKFERTHYIHPLYSLDGEILTEDFPEDHPHHRSIFWAWHQIWIGSERIGDGWSLKNFIQEVDNIEISQNDSSSVVFHTQVLWKSPLWRDKKNQLKPYLVENTYIKIYQSQENFRIIDFEIGLRALENNIKIGRSEDQKGYGGFSVRIKLPEGIKFISSSGEIEPRKLQINAGPSMDFSGTFRENGEISGLTIFCHPTNPSFPQPWIVRRRGSMQNVVFPGRNPILVPTDRNLILRYRLVVHRDLSRDLDLKKLFGEYSRKSDFLLEN